MRLWFERGGQTSPLFSPLVKESEPDRSKPLLRTYVDSAFSENAIPPFHLRKNRPKDQKNSRSVILGHQDVAGDGGWPWLSGCGIGMGNQA